MILNIVHETTYEYQDPVSTSHHELHLTPQDGAGQSRLSHDIAVWPAPTYLHERLDYFRNRACHFSIHAPHRSLRIVARSEVRLDPNVRRLPLWSPPWEEVREQVTRDRTPDALAAYEFVFDSAFVAANAGLLEFGRASFPAGRPLLEAMRDLTHRIFKEFVFDPSATQVSTPIAEVMRLRRGVCQDFAHVQIGCLRALGLPARYVSGYLMTLPPPGKPKLIGVDASHAWVSTYFPNVGWIDFDPTNDAIHPGEYVTVAYGRDFGDVTPVRGVILGGGRHALRVAVDVNRLDQPTTADAEPAI